MCAHRKEPQLTVAGSVLTGFISDYFKAPALTCSALLYASVATVRVPPRSPR